MKILSVGPGAVGSYFCGRLAQHGAEVEMILRSNAELIARDGIFVESDRPEGDFHFRPAGILKKASEASPDIDYIIVSLKVLPEINAPALIAEAANRPNHPPIVLIQNGIGIEEPFAQAFPENEIISVIARIGASRPAPGRTRQRGRAGLAMGIYQGDSPVKCQRLVSAFQQAGVDCFFTENIQLERWKKLLWNLAFNTVSVIGGGVTTDQMCSGGDLEALCLKLMKETVMAAACAGITLDRSMIDAQFESNRQVAPFKTSMLQDFEAGRPVECDAIIGNALALAEKHGLDLPVMRCCATLLRAAVSRRQILVKSSESDSVENISSLLRPPSI